MQVARTAMGLATVGLAGGMLASGVAMTHRAATIGFDKPLDNLILGGIGAAPLIAGSMMLKGAASSVMGGTSKGAPLMIGAAVAAGVGGMLIADIAERN